jgi:hypothetical protein
VAVVLVVVLAAAAVAIAMPLLVAPGSSGMLDSVNEGGVGRKRFREGNSDGCGGALVDLAGVTSRPRGARSGWRGSSASCACWWWRRGCELVAEDVGRAAAAAKAGAPPATEGGR